MAQQQTCGDRFTECFNDLEDRAYFREQLEKYSESYFWYFIALQWGYDAVDSPIGMWYEPSAFALRIGLAFFCNDELRTCVPPRTDPKLLERMALQLGVEEENVVDEPYRHLWDNLIPRLNWQASGLATAIDTAMKKSSLDESDRQLLYLGLALFFTPIIEELEQLATDRQEIEKLIKPLGKAP